MIINISCCWWFCVLYFALFCITGTCTCTRGSVVLVLVYCSAKNHSSCCCAGTWTPPVEKTLELDNGGIPLLIFSVVSQELTQMIPRSCTSIFSILLQVLGRVQVPGTVVFGICTTGSSTKPIFNFLNNPSWEFRDYKYVKVVQVLEYHIIHYCERYKYSCTWYVLLCWGEQY